MSKGTMPIGASGSRSDVPDPVDLLWRTQFQNQHAHLLKRMNTLEEKVTVYDGRTRKAEQAAATCGAATTEVKDIKARLQAFEEDSRGQEKDQLVSKTLAEQTRDMAIMKDKAKRVDGLVFDYRAQQEDLEKLRETLGAYTKTVKGLEAQLNKFKDNSHSDIDTNAVQDARARLEYLETRDVTRDHQLRNVQNILNTIEVDCKNKTMEINRLREEVAKGRGNRSMGKPGNSEIQVQRSPSVLRALPPRRAEQKKPLRHGFITHTSEQDAQMPPLLLETQTTTQATTQTEASTEQNPGSTYDGDEEPIQPRDMHYDGPKPKKKQRLANDTKVRRVEREVRPGASNKVSSSFRRIVTLRYAPQSSFVIPTSAKRLPNERAVDASTRARAPLAQSSLPVPGQGRGGSTQMTQSQTNQFLRRSARNMGLEASSDTQHVELVRDGLYRPQPMSGKRIINEPTSPVKAARPPKPSALNSRPIASNLETRKRRKPPQLEDSG